MMWSAEHRGCTIPSPPGDPKFIQPVDTPLHAWVIYCTMQEPGLVPLPLSPSAAGVYRTHSLPLPFPKHGGNKPFTQGAFHSPGLSLHIPRGAGRAQPLLGEHGLKEELCQPPAASTLCLDPDGLRGRTALP
ncbi:hypothetical protein DV515_00007460, partial [Chloebia gouldiae]